MTNAANQAAHRARRKAAGDKLMWIPAALLPAVSELIATMVAEHKGETE